MRYDVAFVENESDDAKEAEEEGEKGAPGGPREHDSTPGDWHQKAGYRGSEEDGSGPVYLAEFRKEGTRSFFKGKEEGEGEEAKPAEREENPEKPSPLGPC